MGADTRATLVDAGISALGRQRFQELLAGVDTRAIADEVGVTTGSFFHHFRNRSHYALAVVNGFVDRWHARVAHLQDASTTAVEHDGLSGLRQATGAEWDGLVNADETPILQHLLWAVRDEPVCDDTGRTAGAVLAECYAGLTAAVESTYQRGLARMGREMLPPFTSRDLTVIMTAFAEGMQMRHAVDPDVVRADLYSDAVAAILLGVTRPRVERSDTVPAPELSTLETRYLVHQRTGPAAEVPVETWRHIADSAAHLFVDRPLGDVRISEVAAAAGVSTTTVYHHFGTVAAVAAAGWARHVPDLEAIAAAPLTAEEGPILRIEQVPLRYVELARQNRGATEALANQIITEAGTSDDRRWPRSTASIVPLPAILLPLIRELRALGRLRRRVETERLARSLLQHAGAARHRGVRRADRRRDRVPDLRRRPGRAGRLNPNEPDRPVEPEILAPVPGRTCRSDAMEIGTGHASATAVADAVPVEMQPLSEEVLHRLLDRSADLTGRELLGDLPTIARTLRVRDRYLDPIHVLQVALLQRTRALDQAADGDTDRVGDSVEARRLRRALLLSVNGVAAGMRNTG